MLVLGLGTETHVRLALRLADPVLFFCCYQSCLNHLDPPFDAYSNLLNALHSSDPMRYPIRCTTAVSDKPLSVTRRSEWLDCGSELM